MYHSWENPHTQPLDFAHQINYPTLTTLDHNQGKVCLSLYYLGDDQ